MEEMNEAKRLQNEEETKAYLRKHRIAELFEELSAHLIYRQPANAKEFIIEHIAKVKAAKLTKKDFPYLFTENDLKATVRMIDPLGKGFITTDQYNDAMRSLGIVDYNQALPTAAGGKVSTELFLREAKQCLDRKCAMYGTVA